MMVTNLTTTNGADQFYPTPPEVAEKMLAGINWAMVETILEPSAGKGDLILAAARAHFKHDKWGHRHLDVDAVEIDPYLREICKYRFAEERHDEFEDRWCDEAKTLERVEVHMVHDDFMTYRTYKHYDLILMNPPFADGDLHLLRALEMQKDGGHVVCLLNAETIRNPYTASRMLLKQKLRDLDAEIEFLEGAFDHAERQADVDVAIIRVKIPMAEYESTLFERMKKAAEAEHIPDAELKALVPSDYIDRAICLYNAEVAATMELVREYKALQPYINQSFSKGSHYRNDPILTLSVDGENGRYGVDIKKYMRMVRLKYWNALFENEEFTGKLTSNLRDQFFKNIRKMADYEFSAFNIKQIAVEMNASMQQGVRDTIMSLFDKLTVEHTWFPECANNRHYYNGWKTNKAHKVGKKAIIPANGLYSSYSWDKDKGFDVYAAYNVLGDIEKSFDYLDGGQFEGLRYDMSGFLKAASESRQSRNIQCTYFTVDIFKKGTVHIKFRPEAMPLVERLNIFAASGKNWLPPNYGKKTYSNMDADEKAVVDGLNGDGSEGSGEIRYAEVLKNRTYYLGDPTQNMLMLEAAQ